MKAASPVGTEIDWTQTYVEAAREAFVELPFMVKEYLRAMLAPPRAAVVLESVIVAGIPATMNALRDHNLYAAISATVH